MCCYIKINCFINNHDDFAHFLKTAKEKTEFERQSQQSQFSQDPEKSCNDFETISDKSCYSLTGLQKEQLNELVSSLPNIEPPVKFSLNQCLGFYLMKLKLGLSTNHMGLK